MNTELSNLGSAAMSVDRLCAAPQASDIRSQAGSLVEVFRHRARVQPDQIAFTFLRSGETIVSEDRTYAEFDRQARAVATRLQHLCQAGDRALLMFDSGLDYIAALAGCLYAGVIAVPVFPPDPMRVARTLPRLEAIVHDAQASVLLGKSSDLAWAGAMLGQIAGLGELVSSDAIDLRLADQWAQPCLERNSPAFLQYTSGSTGAPKGVLVQHGSVLANMSQMEQMIDLDNALVCTWLPPYHDMGLVGGILQCWYSGRRNVMLSPLTFFQQPLRWLRAVAMYRATTIAAPDFAYELCVRKIKPDDRRGLDLTCLRLALSGAEPVRAATMARFVEAFAECGVREEIFCPCYGMAEATLLVSAARIAAAPVVRTYDAVELSRNIARPTDAAGARTRTLVGCGRTPEGQRLTIVDPQSLTALGSRQVGEIWVAGPNVASEYWRNPTDSRATFQAFTSDGQGPFLRTGDLGFVDADELFISGRCKDLIIVRGRNYHPQDIEQSIETCHPAIKPRGGAAFSIDDGGREQVIVVQEVARPTKVDLNEISQVVRRVVLEAHDLVLDSVVLVRLGTIPKTTSGKIQRQACRALYMCGELEPLGEWRTWPRGAEPECYAPPRNPLEAQLAVAWAEALGVQRVGIFDSFFDLGGSSLLATQLISRLSPQLGVDIPLADLFNRPTIAAMAELIAQLCAVRKAADVALLEYLNGLSDDDAELILAGRGKTHAGPLFTFPSNGASARDNASTT
jgi:acyl-CoA synthetase (AMP-forming)/AMP-acid ligase II/acyl carrier protein